MRAARWTMLIFSTVVVAGLPGPATAAAAVLAPSELSAPALAPNYRMNVTRVSCWAAGDCVAVGSALSANGYVPLVETTTGSSTTATTAPLPADAASTGGSAAISAVSCAPGTASCVAVGTYRTASGNYEGLLLSLTAGSWSAAELQLPGAPASNPEVGLSSVSCPSAGSCAAVGYWDDTSNKDRRMLTVDSAPSSSGAPVFQQAQDVTMPADAATQSTNQELQAVVCAAAGNCVAIGTYQTTSGDLHGLALSETGHVWGAAAGISEPATSGAQFFNLVRLGCRSSGNCVAAGDYRDSAGLQAAEVSETAGTWGNAAKISLPSGAASSGQLAAPVAVACTSSTCSIFGQYLDSQSNTDAFVAAGTTASQLPPPAGSGPGASAFDAVACSSSTCAAVGLYSDQSGQSQLMVSQGSGAVWQPASEITRPADVSLDPTFGAPVVQGLACAGGSCEGAGYYDDTSANGQPMLVSGTLGGSFTAAKAPAPAALQPPVMLLDVPSVACAANGECAAAGQMAASGGARIGLVNETGGVAGPVLAPMPADAQITDLGRLSGIACPAPGSCVAVGSYTRDTGGASAGTAGLVMGSSGGTWSTGVSPALPADHASSGQSWVNGVACASSGNCMAIGTYTTTSSATAGLLLSQSGGSWSSAAQAPVLTGATPAIAIAQSVACAPAGGCLASGWSYDSSGAIQPVVFSSGAGGWTVTRITPASDAATNPNATSSQISCPVSGDCSAAWQYLDINGVHKLMVASESGGSWGPGSSLQLPNNASQNLSPTLAALSCAAAGECEVAGIYYDSGNLPHSFVAAQSAGGWGAASELPAPAGSGGVSVRLSGLSCSSSGDCVAVGTYFANNLQRPLLATEHAGSWSEPSIPAVKNSGASVGDLEGVACAPAGGCMVTGQDSTGQAITLNLTAPTSVQLSGAPASGQAGGAIVTTLGATFGAEVPSAGTVSFVVFGPSAAPPASCASGATVLGTAALGGHSPASVPVTFTPTVAGDYWWYASYGGGPLDDASASTCGAGMPETIVSAAGGSQPPPPPPAHASLRLVKLTSKHGVVTVTLTCSGAPCAAGVLLSTPARKRRHHKQLPITLARASATIPVGHSVTLRLRWKGSPARSRRVNATLTVSLSGREVAQKRLLVSVRTR